MPQGSPGPDQTHGLQGAFVPGVGTNSVSVHTNELSGFGTEMETTAI